MRPARTSRREPRAAFAASGMAARPLLKTTDHGPALTIRASSVGAAGDRWADPFLVANATELHRLELRAEVAVDRELFVRLIPGPRIGAMPLLSPTTRKVVAGLLVEPRFSWSALGAVFNTIGFSVEPTMGGAPLVPGSAREVPPWMLAGPVIERLAALLRARQRGFVERNEIRAAPRGRIDWQAWASQAVPRGHWTAFPCHYTEPGADPGMLAAVRWTLDRLEVELATVSTTLPGRALLGRVSEMQHAIGEGPLRRPGQSLSVGIGGSTLREALEAMSWVAEERGLGGARCLDGLAWDLSVEAVWEAWVASTASVLAARTGLVASPPGGARRTLRWCGPAQSMGSLIPDVELRGTDRVVWIDAKYKAHYALLARRGWQGASDDLRSEHRADIHQALAYASLADVSAVDTVLAYPQLGAEGLQDPSVATVTSGRRRVRIILAAFPFGYRSPDHQERHLAALRDLLQS